MEYKVGQKVRIKATTGQNGFEKDQIVEITGLPTSPGRAFKLTGHPVRKGFYQGTQHVPEEYFNPVEEATPVIDFTKPLETVSGEPVVILSMEGRGTFPVVVYVGDRDYTMAYNLQGEPGSGHPAFNLRNVVVKPLESEGYMNVYKGVDGLSAGSVWESREWADSEACCDRVARLKVKLVEGQFDE